jgi:hypothetical protein
LKQAVVVVVLAFLAAQLFRPERANRPIDPTRTIQAYATASGVAPVLDRSCGDCHSNASAWPWYAQIAPASWLMAAAIDRGRKAVNFSEWGTYPPDVQRSLLAASCRDVSTGKMPGVYERLRPETRLSAAEVKAICAAASETASRAAAAR